MSGVLQTPLHNPNIFPKLTFGSPKILDKYPKPLTLNPNTYILQEFTFSFPQNTGEVGVGLLPLEALEEK